MANSDGSVANQSSNDDNDTLDQFNASHQSGQATTYFPIPGLEFLGMGYDVFGRYASVDSCKQNIIDFSAENRIDQPTFNRNPDPETLAKAFSQLPAQISDIYTRPDTVTYAPRFQIESVNEFDGTISEQMTKWSAHVNVSGSYGAFAGEIDARFSSNLSKLATTKHYSLVSKSTYWQLNLAYSLGHPAPLKQEVQDDLDNPQVDCNAFFDNYGTHYLSSVAIGCKVTISCEIDTSRAESDFDFSSYLKATYEGEGASAGVTGDATYQNKVKRFQDYSKTTVFGVGISDDQIDNIKAGAESGVSVLKGGWHNPSLIDFPSDALKPIWDHCTDPAQKQKFQAAFDKLAANRVSVISDLSLYKPVYLYRGQVNGGITYRLYDTTNLAGSDDAGGIAWQIQNNGKPFINIAAKQILGRAMNPIRAWRHAPERQIWRYAIRGLGPMGGGGNNWELVSSEPIGWAALPPDNWRGPLNELPDGIRPVYFYVSPTVPLITYYSRDELDNTRAPGESWVRSTPRLELRELPGAPWESHADYDSSYDQPNGAEFLGWLPD